MWIGRQAWEALLADIAATRRDVGVIKQVLSGRLSPADQAKLNEIYDRATRSSAKLGDAQKE